MVGFIGRKIALTWNGAAVDGVREKGIALNGEPVDVTDDVSDGWRELLAEAGEHQVNISLSGVTKSDDLKVSWFAVTDRIKAVTITYPDGGVLAGNFFLASFSETGPYLDATTFEAEIQSTGAVTFTPGA